MLRRLLGLALLLVPIPYVVLILWMIREWPWWAVIPVTAAGIYGASLVAFYLGLYFLCVPKAQPKTEVLR